VLAVDVDGGTERLHLVAGGSGCRHAYAQECTGAAEQGTLVAQRAKRRLGGCRGQGDNRMLAHDRRLRGATARRNQQRSQE